MIWISLFSLWSSWYSFSAHCQPTHFLCVCVCGRGCGCVCSYVYLYLFSLHCTKCKVIFFYTWSVLAAAQSLFIEFYSLLLIPGPGLLRCCQAGLQWGWQYVLCESFAHKYTCDFSRLLTLSVFLSLLSHSFSLVTLTSLGTIKPLCCIYWCDLF